MKIQLFGSSCAACDKMKTHVHDAVAQLQLPCDLEVVTRIADMIDLGITQTPSLAINGRVMSSGRVLDVDTIKGMLSAAAAGENHP